jgi:hypothetical protein
MAMGEDPKILDYATPKVPQNRRRMASPRRMFFLLLPAGIFGATFIPSMMIGALKLDDRNFGGACILLVSAPLALVFGIIAVIEAVRRDHGGSAFIWGAAWNVLLIAVLSAVFDFLVR